MFHGLSICSCMRINNIIADHYFVQSLKLGWPLLLLISVTYKFHY